MIASGADQSKLEQARVKQVQPYYANMGVIKLALCLRSMACLVIQATGRTKFEDGVRPISPRRSVVTDSVSAQAHSLVTTVL